MAFDYSLDETFDIGCDKGSPVTDEYRALSAFTGKIVEVTMDLNPQVAFDAELHSDAQARAAMISQ